MRFYLLVCAALAGCSSNLTDSAVIAPASRPAAGVGTAPAADEPAPTAPDKPDVNTVIPANPDPVPANSVTFVGRVVTGAAAGGVAAVFSWPGVSLGFRFAGTDLAVTLSEIPHVFGTNRGPHYFDVIIDGQRSAMPVAVEGTDAKAYKVAAQLATGEHTVWLVKRTSGMIGSIRYHGATPEGGGWLDAPAPKSRRLTVLGASADCGYGAEATNCRGYQSLQENQNKAWGQLAADTLGADLHNISYAGKGITINYTPMDDPVLTLPKTYPLADPNGDDQAWDFSKWIPDVVVINAGRNDWDGNQKKAPNASRFQAAYVALLDAIVMHAPKAHVYALLNPYVEEERRPVLKTYLQAAVAAEVAKGNAQVHFVELPQLNAAESDYACDHHPSQAMHQKMAEQMAAIIKDDLGW